MTIAHLILAHKAPAQLERLVQALTYQQDRVFIHLDLKTDYQPFAKLALLPNVQFIRHRIDVKWGGYSLTQAALEGMREILGTSVKYDFINLLSGEDYPIKPPAVIHEYLVLYPGSSFMAYHVDSAVWWQHNQKRLTQYHLTNFRFHGQYFVQRVLNRLLPARKARPFPILNGDNAGGWYTISPECAAYLIDFLDNNARLRRFARFTWGSDEFLLHSILLNSPMAATIINNNLRYIDWSGGGSSPKTLTCADLPALLSSCQLYARKFNLDQDSSVIDQLDLANNPRIYAV
ncbi:MAG: beta-1,6-N-acetylglucosaminyltransferase [Janthinobacterium lividum]